MATRSCSMLSRWRTVTVSVEVFAIRAFFAEGFEVDGNAEGGTHFVLAAVATANGSGLIVKDIHVRLQQVFDLLRLGNKFRFVFEQGENGCLDGRNTWLEPHDLADVGLATFLGEVFLVVGLAEDGQQGAVASRGGFDNVGDEPFLGLGIKYSSVLPECS